MRNLRASFWLWAMQVFPRWRYARRMANEANQRQWDRVARCETCRWYDNQYATAGSCKRNPPERNGIHALWPMVKASDWCGEHAAGGGRG